MHSVPINAAGSEWTLRLRIFVVDGFAYFQEVKIAFFHDYVVRVDAEVVAVHFWKFAGNSHGGFLVGVWNTYGISGTVCSSGDVDCVVLYQCIFIQHFLQPVCPFPCSVLYGLQIPFRNIGRPVVRTQSVHYTAFILHHHVLLGIEDSRDFVEVLHTDIAIVTDFGNAGFTSFGGNQDNAVGSTRTIDGGRSGILQDVQRFNVTRVQSVDATVGNSIYHIKRGEGSGSTDTADIHLKARTQEAVVLRDVDTRWLALQSAQGIHSVQLGYVFSFYLYSGAGDKFLFLYTVTDNNYFIQ